MALRTSLVAQPHLYMGDTTGRPLDAGKVYFGEPNKDPELYPINVFYDEALTIAAPQPIRTMGGFMNANGQMVEVYAAESSYSVKVLDGYGREVFYQESMSSANAQLEAQKLDTGITATAKFGGVNRDQSDKNTDTLSIADLGSVSTALSVSKSTGRTIQGAHTTNAVTDVPNLASFQDADFAKPVTGGTLHYAAEKYRTVRKSKITNTTDYTGWTQDKCFEYNGVIYAPYQLSTQHTAVGQRIAWSRSFDKGNTWTQPEILLDAATNPLRGWNCFSMGESGGRLYAMMEWRTDTSTDDTEFYLYSRPLDRTRKMTGGVTKAINETYLTVVINDHGLIAGDNMFFTGTGISGLSGKVTVLSVVNKNTFRVTAPAASIPLAIDNTGSVYYCTIEFGSNLWATQLVTTSMTIGTTSKIVHVHSFADIDGDSFIMGFGFGGTTADPVRQVGYFHVQNIHGTAATLTKYRINATDEALSTEPCVIYDSAENMVYLSTRNQSGSSYAAITRSVLNSGDWTTVKLPFKSVFCNLPIVKRDNKLYVFGTERGKNGFIDASADYISKGVQDAATYLYEITDFDESSIKVSVLTYDTHGGDSSVTGVGVGSAIYAFGRLMYFYGSESADSQHLYGTNSSSYDSRSRFNNNGFQPDIMLLEITLEQYVSTQDFALTGYDSKTLPIVRNSSNVRSVDAPLNFKYPVGLAGGINTSVLFDAGDITLIGNNTSTGSDTRMIALCSSQSISGSRGASVWAYGANHPTSPNRLVLSGSAEVLVASASLKPFGSNTTDLGSEAVRFTTAYFKNLNVSALAVYSDNAAAKSGGLVTGDTYRTSNGQMMIVY